MPSITIRLAGQGRDWILPGASGAELRAQNLRELQPEEAALLKYLPPFAGRVVIPQTGGSPLIPAAIAALNPGATIEVLELDMHDARLLREKLALLKNVQVLCAADPLSTPDVAQAAVLLFRERTDRLLAFDLIERLDHILPAGSPVVVMLPKKRTADFSRKLERHLLKRRVLQSAHHVHIVQGVTGGDPAAWTPRLHEFVASTPTEKVRLCSRPGVFAHARPDAGGLALAECAEVHPGQHILELGCGCGLIGLLLAARLQQAGATAEFILVDSNARAVECAKRSVEVNGLAGVRVEHADVFKPQPDSCDAVLGNPPYFAGHRIAEYFIEVAACALKAGGILWLVSKHGDEIDRYASSCGFKVETRHRRGYDISVCRR